MAVSSILSFLIASALLTLAPGPDNIFVLTESVTKGSKNGIAISIGLVLGILVHTSIVVLGVAMILQNNPLLFNLIKILGACYLFYLAYLSFKEKPIQLDLKTESHSTFSWPKLIGKGFLMNVLNPKVSLFFISFLPQFITPSDLSNSLQITILGLLFMGQALIIFVFISTLSGIFSKLTNNPKFWTKIKWGKVIILSLIGISILL